MKKTKKIPALRITRETLVVLSDARLSEAAGGSNQSLPGHPCGHSNGAACVE